MRYCSICRQILVEVGDDVALDRDIFHIKRHAACRHGIDARGVIHEIGGEGAVGDLLLAQIPCELVDDGGNHLHMRQLLGSDVGQDSRDLPIGHGIALIEIAH